MINLSIKVNKMVDQNEKELIERVLQGEKSAFREIVVNYQKLVNHIAYKMIPQETERDDICQDVFIKVYQNLGSFQFGSKLSTWIGRITYNRCLTYLEKKKPLLFEDFAEKNQTLDSLQSDVFDPEKILLSSDLSVRIRSEINLLPIKFKTILSLYHLEEMTYDEIGKIMKLPSGTVKSYIFRGRKMLKDRLLQKYNQEDL
ncbi:MAG: RNA polymerase sigma factor [Candidatus Zixiibacteriota bacterium]|nr:MAG: RNA polymerase sigma factor [candidate division Zixibacteria bacterium]